MEDRMDIRRVDVTAETCSTRLMRDPCRDLSLEGDAAAPAATLSRA